MAVAQTPTGPGWSIGLERIDDLDGLMKRMETGLRASAEQHLRALLDVPLAEMARLLGTSARTLGRRQSDGRLTAEESDRLYRYARLFERGVEVMGTEEQARQWMKSEQWALGGRVSLDVARYEPGAREVEDLLGRIEHGIPV